MGIQIEPDLDHNMQYIQGLQKISAKLIHMMNCGTCQYTSLKQLELCTHVSTIGQVVQRGFILPLFPKDVIYYFWLNNILTKTRA